MHEKCRNPVEGMVCHYPISKYLSKLLLEILTSSPSFHPRRRRQKRLVGKFYATSSSMVPKAKLIIINNYIISTHYKSYHISLNMQAFYSITNYTPCHHPLYVMSSSTKPPIYVFNQFSVANSIYS
jgi:hypothetical protein